MSTVKEQIMNPVRKVRTAKEQAAKPMTAGKTTAELAADQTGQNWSNERILEYLGGHKLETKEEKDAREKREKRDKMWAAIGDGISALSNLYYTTKGAPNSWETGRSMSDVAQRRWDRINKERLDSEQRLLPLYMQTAQLEEQRRRWQEDKAWREAKEKKDDERYDRNWQRTLDREAKADQARAEDIAFRKSEAERNQNNTDEANRRARAALNQQAHNAAENRKIQQARIDAINARTRDAQRGKAQKFKSADGKESVTIYDNVWKGSMEQVYDVMADEFKRRRQAGEKDLPFVPYKATKAEKETFVKEHWADSEEGRKAMRILAGIDPAAEVSDEKSEWDQYLVEED